MAPKPDQALEDAMKADTSPKAAQTTTTIDPNVIALAKTLAAEMFAQAQATRAEDQAFQRELVDKQSAAHRETMEAATRKPENASPPLMSDFNPLGDRDHPRPQLPWPVTMNDAEMPEHLLTTEELTLLQQLTPGHYRVRKTDDTDVTVSVVPSYDDASGAITKMTLVSKFGGKNKNEDAKNWYPLRVWLAQLLGVPAPERPITRLPLGRMVGPVGAVGRQPGMVRSLDDALAATGADALGPVITRDIQRMQAIETDPMEPSRA